MHVGYYVGIRSGSKKRHSVGRPSIYERQRMVAHASDSLIYSSSCDMCVSLRRRMRQPTKTRLRRQIDEGATVSFAGSSSVTRSRNFIYWSHLD